MYLGRCRNAQYLNEALTASHAWEHGHRPYGQISHVVESVVMRVRIVYSCLKTTANKLVLKV